jgi:hypothetical protein
MRVLEAWCADLKGRDMKTIDTDTIIQFLEKFYTIHEKIHHRVLIILGYIMSDSTSMEELDCINHINNQFLEEQKRLNSIIMALRSKTFF